MEQHSNPNQIKEYYIAYFDILGYREFFNELVKNNQLEKVETFLSDIHKAIDNVKRKLLSFNNSTLFDGIQDADFDFKIKVFSDNFIICLERHQDTYTEKIRALTFLEIISEIQRSFIIVHNLFVRGGVTIGRISFNDDYVFGQGVIDAVELEETTIYPRIVIDKPILDFMIAPLSFSPEESEKAQNIENMRNDGKEVSNEDNDFYYQLKSRSCLEGTLIMAFCKMVYLSDDKCHCISYLHILDPREFVNSKFISDAIAFVKLASPDLADKLSKSLLNMSTEIAEMLRVHKNQVESQIQKYGTYNDISLDNHKDAIRRERVLKKYAWVMRYHNIICINYQNNEYYIRSIANCDARFMTLMINTVELPLPSDDQRVNANDDASNSNK